MYIFVQCHPGVVRGCEYVGSDVWLYPVSWAEWIIFSKFFLLVNQAQLYFLRKCVHYTQVNMACRESNDNVIKSRKYRFRWPSWWASGSRHRGLYTTPLIPLHCTWHRRNVPSHCWMQPGMSSSQVGLLRLQWVAPHVSIFQHQPEGMDFTISLSAGCLLSMSSLANY